MSLITKIEENNNSKTLHFSKLLNCVDDLKQLDIKDEYQSACALIFTLATFENDEKAAKEMFEYINGPEDMSAFDLSFIKNQFSQYPFVVRSYFENTNIENDYQLNDDIALTIKENIYSRKEDNYIRFVIESSGADTERNFTLRKKPSTGEWFLFSDSYKGLLAGIRMPNKTDKWA